LAVLGFLDLYRLSRALSSVDEAASIIPADWLDSFGREGEGVKVATPVIKIKCVVHRLSPSLAFSSGAGAVS
jgi:hypothetical protein